MIHTILQRIQERQQLFVAPSGWPFPRFLFLDDLRVGIEARRRGFGRPEVRRELILVRLNQTQMLSIWCQADWQTRIEWPKFVMF